MQIFNESREFSVLMNNHLSFFHHRFLVLLMETNRIRWQNVSLHGATVWLATFLFLFNEKRRNGRWCSILPHNQLFIHPNFLYKEKSCHNVLSIILHCSAESTKMDQKQQMWFVKYNLYKSCHLLEWCRILCDIYIWVALRFRFPW